MVTPKVSMSTEGETLQVSVLPYRCSICPPLVTRLMSPRVDISSTCKVGQKLGVSLPLLTCSPSAWPSRLLYRRGRKSRRDLRITLYVLSVSKVAKFRVGHRHRSSKKTAWRLLWLNCPACLDTVNLMMMMMMITCFGDVHVGLPLSLNTPHYWKGISRWQHSVAVLCS